MAETALAGKRIHTGGELLSQVGKLETMIICTHPVPQIKPEPNLDTALAAAREDNLSRIV